MPQGWRKSVLRALEVNLVILLIDSALAIVWLLVSNSGVLSPIRKDFFSMLLLLESGLVFLVAGIVAFGGSIFPSKVREHVFHSEEKWSKEKLNKGEARANLYILAGAFLFLESLAVALLE